MKYTKAILFWVTILLLTGLMTGCAISPQSNPEAEIVPAATKPPTKAPEKEPTVEPTEAPTEVPTAEPTQEPTEIPEVTIEVVDGSGENFVLDGPAERIISLAPSNTEILFAVGAGSQVVGRDTFSDYPAEAMEITDIGGGWGELNLETIVALEPDLVLSADIIAAEQVQALKDLGLPVFMLPNPVTLDEMLDNLEVVAILTGQDASGLIVELQGRIATVEEKVAQVETRPLVFYELDGSEPNAPWTSGPGTFIDTLITMAGGENLGNALDGAWVQVSLEELVSQDPDIILLGDYIWGGITPEMVAARGGWEGLSAVVKGQVYPFDDNLVSRPGPRMVDGLEELAKLFHPSLFE